MAIKSKITEETESVKISKKILNKIRGKKVKTGVSIRSFLEQAAIEKLNADKNDK